MKTEQEIKKIISFEQYLKEQLKNPVVRKYYDRAGKQLEIAYKVVQLRKQQKMSQLELANKLNTTQGNIARLEAGRQNFTITTLEKIAQAFKRDLKIEFV